MPRKISREELSDKIHANLTGMFNEIGKDKFDAYDMLEIISDLMGDFINKWVPEEDKLEALNVAGAALVNATGIPPDVIKKDSFDRLFADSSVGRA